MSLPLCVLCSRIHTHLLDARVVSAMLFISRQSRYCGSLFSANGQMDNCNQLHVSQPHMSQSQPNSQIICGMSVWATASPSRLLSCPWTDSENDHGRGLRLSFLHHSPERLRVANQNPLASPMQPRLPTGLLPTMIQRSALRRAPSIEASGNLIPLLCEPE